MNNQQAMALLVESEQIISKDDFRNLFDSQKNHVDVQKILRDYVSMEVQCPNNFQKFSYDA